VSGVVALEAVLAPIEFVMSDVSVDLELAGGELSWADLQHRTRVTPERLDAALRRLMAAGHVAEIEGADAEFRSSSFLLLRRFAGEMVTS
jgi:hypothetical protein